MTNEHKNPPQADAAIAAGGAQEPVATVGWTGHGEADNAIILLGRLDVSADDDARVDQIECAIRYLAKQAVAATGDREFHEAAVKLVRDMMDLIPSFSVPSDLLARINALLTAPVPALLARQPAAIDKQGAVTDERRQAARDAVAAALGDAYDCMRVWEAWSVGTMSQDDFQLVADDESRIAEIADAAIDALYSAPLANEASKPAASHIDTTDCEDCGTLGVSVGANCPRCGRLIAAPSVEQDAALLRKEGDK